ncbi:hypothetical protein KKB18_12850 [bacterium]|nr:hypothetical protein [bacterium]
MKNITRNFPCWNCFCLILLILFSFVINGCTQWIKHGIVLHKEKVRIAVLPVRSEVRIKHLKNIKSVPKIKMDPKMETELVRTEMDRVTEQIGYDIEKKLDESFFLKPVPNQEINPVLDDLDLCDIDRDLTSNEIKELGYKLSAPLIMMTEVAGYGRIKRVWTFYLIGCGVIEGIVDGVIGTVATTNYWVGIGLAAEEILQESLTWGGGVFLFNRIFTPVVLETKVFSAQDGHLIWQKTTFEKISRKGLKRLPEKDRKKKEYRLEVTSDKAIDTMIRKLDKKAYKSIEYNEP